MQFSFIRRLCVRLSSRCGIVYEERPDLQRFTPAAFAEAVYADLRNQKALKEWEDDEIRNVIRQCGELGEHIWDTRMRQVLMSAKAAKMDDAGKSNESSPLMGHCAAMIVRGAASCMATAAKAGITAPQPSIQAEGSPAPANTHSNYDRILAELTAPIRIESFINRKPPSDKLSAFVSRKLRGSGLKPAQTEAGFYNQCTLMMAPCDGVKPWVHVGELKGVFWHVVTSIGDTLVVKDGVVGVPITEACSAMDTSVQGIKVSFSKEEADETRMIARYALPPIDNRAGMFSGDISRPLARSLYGEDNIPITYIVPNANSEDVKEWIRQSPNTRYTVAIGEHVAAIHQMSKRSIEKLRESATQTKRFTVVRDM
eukprot:762886-Hanusia_phi.AAC.1